MKKLVLIVLILGLALFGSWYFLIKKGEFEVHFKVKTLPGDVGQTLAIWDNTLPETELLELSTTEAVQHAKIEGSDYRLEWNFELINDSTCYVNVAFTEPGNEFMNKLLVPVSKTKIEEDAEQFARKFFDILKEHLKITSVNVNGIAQLEQKFCACIPMETMQTEKAYGMQRVYGYIVSFITDNQLKASGKPILDIREWDQEKNELTYDFCFPVQPVESLPQSNDIFFKRIDGTKALKATYNGNYITSDRAWYYLIQHAERNNIELRDYPKEVFFDNPNTGMNETQWTAEIYWPIDEKLMSADTN